MARFEILVEEFSDLTQIARDKGLAKIGDAFVNLVYSLALSLVSHVRTGEKVSKKILAGALKYAHMKIYAPRRADAHDMADSVEAVLGYCWLKGLLTLEDATQILVDALELSQKDPELSALDHGTYAFGTLLEKVKERIPITYLQV